MGFFSDLKEDLSQAVSEFSGEDKEKEVAVSEPVNEEPVDIFAAAEESMGITYEDAPDRMDDAKVEEALGSFLDQVAANAESSQERYDAAQESYREEYTYSPIDTARDSYVQTYEEKEENIISDEVAVVTRNMIITGDMVSTGSIEVMGVVRGNIKVNGELNVTGEIYGNSEASNIIMTNANVTGDVTSSGAVKIGTKAVVRGNIYATSAVISGAIKGDIDVHGPVILDSTAIVMGNIKSKAVQINNGAAIEGMCSQCYAEVSPSAFFRE